MVVTRSTQLRRADPHLNRKFVDYTREFLAQPRSYSDVELWLEKLSLKPPIEDLARFYGVNVLVCRGFTSLSAITRGLERAVQRNVKLILFIGDFDASGLEIQKVAEREMRLVFRRVMVTYEQAKKLNLAPIPVNMRDSRAEEYVSRYGNESWEVEAIRPRTFRRILETALKEVIPEEFLLELRLSERAERVARPLEMRFAEAIRGRAVELKKKGLSDKEVRRRLAEEFGGFLK
jgi:hypothetical protein